MKIDVYNREQFTMLKPDKDTAVISCQTPATIWGEGTISDVPNGWGNVLVLRFHDVIQKSSPEMVVFDSDMADRIVEFVECERADSTGLMYGDLVIHCDAGQSRSVAIGLWMSQYCDSSTGEIPLCLHAASNAGSYNSTVLLELRRAEHRHWYGEDYSWPASDND